MFISGSIDRCILRHGVRARFRAALHMGRHLERQAIMVSRFSSAASMTQNTRSGVGRLSDDKRKAIAFQALARTEPISALAERNGVSRPTVYRQIGTARAALDEAFDTTRAADADQVLFMLPVTRQWLDQVVVALTMVGHVSFRGTLELMHDLLGVSTSLG